MSTDYFNSKNTALSLLKMIMDKKQLSSPDEKTLEACIDELFMYPLIGDGLDKAEFTAFAKSAVSMTVFELGGMLSDLENKPEPWVAGRWKNPADTAYWQAYKGVLLNKGWHENVIANIDRKTDEILDNCGDPRDLKHGWQWRGLVIGDVQSGKTAVFTGLLNKAADAGYRVIIVLTGVLETLRKQTQARLQKEFVGTFGNHSPMDDVGSLRPGFCNGEKRMPVCLTSVECDFGSFNRNMQFTLSTSKEPVLFVVKKNSTVLRNLLDWLRTNNACSSDSDDLHPEINEPLLLIDDEADNASVNTAKEKEEMTSVNKSIRELLQVFRHGTYIGFTATPFANVFINPDDEDEALKDLFPRNFICCTDIPNIYYGVHRMVGDADPDDSGSLPEDDPKSSHVRIIQDGEEGFPLKHKQTDVDDITLTPSLRIALRQFLLINAIRDLRHEGATHRSMLVNVSRFTLAHNRLLKLIEEDLENIVIAVRIAGCSDLAEQNPEVRRLQEVFNNYFPDCGFSWAQVKEVLYESIRPIAVYTVNQDASDKLDYSAAEKAGLRAIAVGGLSLSRGVTFEGLCVSYLYRSTACYDTLLQMGRWFGYRAGYEDLCQIWLSETTLNYYAQIARATTDLKDQVKRMAAEGRTPAEFGLCVRDSPDALMITSNNKMRSAKPVVWYASYSSRIVETPKVLRDDRVNNIEVTERLLQKIEASGISAEDIRGKSDRQIYRNVPKAMIADFVRSFRVHKSNYQLAADNPEFGIASFIENNDVPSLDTWDVAVWGSSEDNEPIRLNGKIFASLRRTISNVEEWNNHNTLGIARNRVSVTEMESASMSEEVYESYKGAARSEIRLARKRPLLVLMPVSLVAPKPQTGMGTDQASLEGEIGVHMTYMLSFMNFDGSEQNNAPRITRVKYRVNRIWVEEHLGEGALDIDD